MNGSNVRGKFRLVLQSRWRWLQRGNFANFLHLLRLFFSNARYTKKFFLFILQFDNPFFLQQVNIFQSLVVGLKTKIMRIEMLTIVQTMGTIKASETARCSNPQLRV